MRENAERGQPAVEIRCPHEGCGGKAAADGTHCQSCREDLRTYVRLFVLPAHLYNQGLKAFREKKLERAIELLLVSSEMNRKDPDPLIVLGKIFAKVEKYEEAVEFLLDAVEIDGANETALRCLVEVRKLSESKTRKRTKTKKKPGRKKKS